MGKPEMRAVDVNSNLKNWPAWEYKDYRLGQKEAKACTDALDNYIWHSVEKQGMPDKNDWYIFKIEYDGHGTVPIDKIDDMTPEELIQSSKLYRYFVSPYMTTHMEELKNEVENLCEGKITHWRKIIDNENAYMEEM